MSALDYVDEETSPFEIENTTLFVPAHTTDRIVSQSGLFTVHPEPEKVFDDDNITKYIFKKEAILRLNIMADKYGINESTIYPGLEGVSKHIAKWNYGSKFFKS